MAITSFLSVKLADRLDGKLFVSESGVTRFISTSGHTAQQVPNCICNVGDFD